MSKYPWYMLVCDVYNCNKRAEYIIEDLNGHVIFRCRGCFTLEEEHWRKLQFERRVTIKQVIWGECKKHSTL